HGDAGHGVSFDIASVYESGNNELNRPPFATLQTSISAQRGPLLFTLSGRNLTNVYAGGFGLTDGGVPYPGLGGPIALPAYTLPAPQLTFSVTRRY
ncbi:MAG: hypothetical protein JOZ59_07585, partial [Candidatus Eremiobacteraeota bacterium]|nr:hypothetical protein [Candidatus Eremiobacteraeota bacterium]